jgi:uncharacterized protein (DUF608 family)
MKIQIIIQPCVGKFNENLQKGTIHEVIDNSKNDPRPGRGIWIMGAYDTPVKLIPGEYTEIKE